MKTDALIEDLARDAEPVADGVMVRRLVMALVAGFGVALLMQWQVIGLRADVNAAWLAVLGKGLFCIGLVFIWSRYLSTLTAPGMQNAVRQISAVIVLIVIAAVGAFSSLDFRSVVGCVSQVMLYAMPALAGLIWVFRQGAPPYPGRTGFAIGIAAGAIGAFAYSLGCLADAPTVVAFRYGIAILVNGAVGFVLGRLLLRW